MGQQPVVPDNVKAAWEGALKKSTAQAIVELACVVEKLVERLPDERERAELAALTGLLTKTDKTLVVDPVKISPLYADALLAARKERDGEVK